MLTVNLQKDQAAAYVVNITDPNGFSQLGTLFCLKPFFKKIIVARGVMRQQKLAGTFTDGFIISFNSL